MRLGSPGIAALLALCATLAGGESLVCRGFPAGIAADAISGVSGYVLVLDGEVTAEAQRPVWFALGTDRTVGGRQALALALDCWWTGNGRLTRSPLIDSGTSLVRGYPALPNTPEGVEDLVSGIMRPWLSGDGGLALDHQTWRWTCTASPLGQARLETILSAIGDPHPRAPDLLGNLALPLDSQLLSRTPTGSDLGSWAIDLAKCSGLTVALAKDVDPAEPAPSGTAATLGEAFTRIRAQGLQAAIFHGCLGISHAMVTDHLHPAIRATVAVLPASHLCRTPEDMRRLASTLAARVAPAAWSQPGWTLTPMTWRLDLLVVGDPPAIHAVMAELEAVDRIGLEAWLR